NRFNLPGVTLELVGGSGVVATTNTAADGTYRFDDIPAGNYQVRVVASSLPAGLVPIFDIDGVATPNVAVVVLAPAENRVGVDFGYCGSAGIGDRVWLDSDGDGVQDAGEPGLSGVSVQLLDSTAAVIASQQTGANGEYLFTGLAPGNYTVRIVTSTLPAGAYPTFDPDGGTAHQASVTLTGPERRLDIDFGYRKSPGTGTLGYWKNHSTAWPVASVTVGNRTYTKSQAISWLGQPTRGNVTIQLFKQLVPAKLNVMIGNDASCIAATIAAADAWFTTWGPVGTNVTNSAAKAAGNALAATLDSYNNGLLCAPHRD
ncbi:MAG: SdrD B-like domain-containing protein, partial [Thermoanaerobaculia bacterium]|nr:SdrD B-like domain-containing protein [Thermoanaerobaculia bacterium]